LNQALTIHSPDIGANPSAEEGGDEGADDATSTVIDVVHSFRLNETSFDKKSYLGHLKQYMKKVKETMKTNGASDEEVKEFETGAQTFAKKVVGSFKDWEFFTGESMDPDGMIVLLNYREDGTTPYAVFCKKKEKKERREKRKKLTCHREARYVRDEGLSFTKSRQAGCISGLLSFSNYALSYDIHEPNKSTLTLLTPILYPLLFLPCDTVYIIWYKGFSLYVSRAYDVAMCKVLLISC